MRHFFHQPWIDRVTQQLLAACQGWEHALAQHVINPQQPSQVAKQMEATVLFAEFPPV